MSNHANWFILFWIYVYASNSNFIFHWILNGKYNFTSDESAVLLSSFMLSLFEFNYQHRFLSNGIGDGRDFEFWWIDVFSSIMLIRWSNKYVIKCYISPILHTLKHNNIISWTQLLGITFISIIIYLPSGNFSRIVIIINCKLYCILSYHLNIRRNSRFFAHFMQMRFSSSYIHCFFNIPPLWPFICTVIASHSTWCIMRVLLAMTSSICMRKQL